MKFLKILSCLLLALPLISSSQSIPDIEGAWKGDDGVYIFADGFYSFASFNSNEFFGTQGGSYSLSNGQISRVVEYNTFDTSTVNSTINDNISLDDNRLVINDRVYSRIDNGTPGDLQGAWLFSGRRQENGEISERRPVGPRKTMKILSGKRFQWIAYNTETKQFMGTGGGTYTTENGEYVETIEFFSRDQSRVGASLPFKYELKDDNWHHSGNNSKGEPLYEVWSRRSE